MRRLSFAAILFLFFWMFSCGGNKTVKKDDKKLSDRQEINKKEDNTVQEEKENIPQSNTENKEEIIKEFNTLMAKYKLNEKEGNIMFADYIEALDEISEDYKNFPEIGFNKGVFYTKISKFKEAYKYLMMTYKKSHYIPALINLSYLAYKLNRISELLPYLKNAASLKKIDKDLKEKLLVNYSFLLIMEKKYDEAIKVIREVLAFKPRSIAAYKNLGIMYTNSKKFSIAQKVIDLSISYTKDKKEQAELYVIKARYYKAKFESVNMIAAYKKAISLDSSNIDANYALALLYIKYGAGDKSVIYLKTLVANYPDNLLFRNLYGIALRMAGKYEKAYEAYSDLIKMEPSYKDAYYNRGLLLQKYMEKPAEAIKDYEKYRSLGGKKDIKARIKICKQMIKDIEMMKKEEQESGE